MKREGMEGEGKSREGGQLRKGSSNGEWEEKG